MDLKSPLIEIGKHRESLIITHRGRIVRLFFTVMVYANGFKKSWEEAFKKSYELQYPAQMPILKLNCA